MAIAPLQIPSSNINNLVDQSQWSSLANLGTVYKQAQEDAAKQRTLAQLGDDPNVNASLLTKSGVPSLASIGLNMQTQQTDRAERIREWEAANRRAEAGETRTATDWTKKGADEEAAAKSVESFWRNRTTPQAAPAAPDAAFTQGAPPIAPSPALPQAPPPVAQPPVAPPMQQAVPLAPGQVPPGGPSVPLPQAPPPVAPVAPSPIAPSQLQATGAMTPQAPPAARLATSLLSGNPAAASSITPEEMGEMYRNPETRELAKVFLQNATKPGTWKVNFDKDTGRVTAYDERDPSATIKDITPPTAGGQAPLTKQEREVQGNYQAAKSILGLNDAQAVAFAANKGKLPGKDDLPVSQQKRVDTLTDQSKTAQRVLTNIGQLRVLSPQAWGFPGATTASAFGASFLPNWAGGKSAVDTQDLINAAHSNVANVAKSVFGSRVTNIDVNLLKDLEGSADQPDAVRQKIYDRAEKVFKQISDEDASEADSIINKTRYKPGGQPPPPPPAATPAPAATAPAATPTLGEFMQKARAANPGYSDGEIAKEWKRRYGS